MEKMESKAMKKFHSKKSKKKDIIKKQLRNKKLKEHLHIFKTAKEADDKYNEIVLTKRIADLEYFPRTHTISWIEFL